MKRQFVILIAFLLTLPLAGWGQELGSPAADERGIAVGFHAGSRGLGVGVRYLYEKADNDWFFGLRAFGLKDSRETKIESQFQDRGSRYVFGKLNRLMVLTPYVGISRQLIPHRSGSFLSLEGSLQAGPALGLLRPYYVDIFEPSPLYPRLGTPEPRPYDPAEHAYVDIVGVSSLFSAGFGEIRMQPGLSFRASALIDLARKESYISGAELAINLDYFFRDVPIMAELENQQIFLSVSLGLVVGNRWNSDEEN